MPGHDNARTRQCPDLTGPGIFRWWRAGALPDVDVVAKRTGTCAVVARLGAGRVRGDGAGLLVESDTVTDVAVGATDVHCSSRVWCCGCASAGTCSRLG